MPLKIINGDITKVKADAIVNAANSALKRGGGVCGAIFSAAGAKPLQAECDSIGYCGVGEAVITKGYALPAKYIIHTVGPVWHGGGSGEEKLLASCYRNSLLIAEEKGLASIAFPLISSGIFGYPREDVKRVAVAEIGEFLKRREMDIFLVLYEG